MDIPAPANATMLLQKSISTMLRTHAEDVEAANVSEDACGMLACSTPGAWRCEAVHNAKHSSCYQCC